MKIIKNYSCRLFSQKAASLVFDRVLNTPLQMYNEKQLSEKFRKISKKALVVEIFFQ